MATDKTQHIKPQGGGITETADKSSGFSPFDEQVDPQEYARLLDLYDSSFRNIAEGEVVKGTVLKVTLSEVIVDVGYKSEGIIPIDEFVDETGQVAVQPGDIVDVLLERTEDREGYVVLSREKAEKMKIWDDVEKAYAERKVVIGRVIERIKGGLAVDIGVRAFLPGSQIDVRPVRNLDALRGQELRMADPRYASRFRYLDAADVDDAVVPFDGLEVVDADGERIGGIDGFVVDADAHRVNHIVVDSGGWFTSGRLLLPIGHAAVAPDRKSLRTDVTRDALRRLPEFDADRFSRFSDEELHAFERHTVIAW